MDSLKIDHLVLELIKRPLLFFLCFLALVLFPFAALSYAFHLYQIKEACEESLIHLHQIHQPHKISRKELKEMTSKLKNTDKDFIQKNLESLNFLEQEKKRLHHFFESEEYTEYKPKKELLFSKTANRLAFKTKALKSTLPYKEEILETTQSIDIDEEDLKKILSLVEDVEIFPYGPYEGKPQLLFLDFFLRKKSFVPYQNVFELNFKLLKRENTP